MILLILKLNLDQLFEFLEETRCEQARAIVDSTFSGAYKHVVLIITQ